MRTVSRKKKLLLLAGLVLIALLALCAWLFGWGGGEIRVLEFSPEDVERIELWHTSVDLPMERVVVTDREEIQTILDGVNSFHFTGSSVKDMFRYGLFSGGSVLYGFDVFLTGSNEKEVTFASNNGDQSMGDIEVSYWISAPTKEGGIPSTARDSLEFFAQFYKND